MQSKNNHSFTSIDQLIPESFNKIEQLFQRKEMITGVPTGYDEIDEITSGLQPSDLIIFAAQPEMGKTSLALNIAQHSALVEKIGVAIFSLSINKENVATRLLGSVSRINSQRIRTGMLHDEDWPKLTRAAGMLTEAPIYIDDDPFMSIFDMRMKLRALSEKADFGLIIVDYLQLMKNHNGCKVRVEELNEITSSLKEIALEHNIPVVALHQLKYDLEDRKKTKVSDFCRYCNAEDNADLIFFIYRDEEYNEDEDNPDIGQAEIIIGKHRNGPTGTVRLAFIKEFMMFENMDSNLVRCF